MVARLTELDTLPEGLLDVSAGDLHRVLPGPSLIHLPGRREPAMFVSVLLHGNEDVGLYALQQVLRVYRERELPRALSVFIGNVEAARHGLRHLADQTDFNRCWPSTELPDSTEAQMMHRVFETMRRRRVFLSVDIHNNTGLNPHYACVNRLDDRFLRLATLFSRTVVYFRRPRGVQSMAFAELCPATTLECGRPGQSHGVEHAAEFLQACLQLSELPGHPVPEHDIDLFHTVAQVKVSEDASFGFERDGVDIRFHRELDHLNFREVAAGTELAVLADPAGPGLIAYDEQGRDVTAEHFERRDNRVVLRHGIMPSMLTLDERVVRQDCLCYLMERLPPSAVSRPDAITG